MSGYTNPAANQQSHSAHTNGAPAQQQQLVPGQLDHPPPAFTLDSGQQPVYTPYPAPLPAQPFSQQPALNLSLLPRATSSGWPPPAGQFYEQGAAQQQYQHSQQYQPIPLVPPPPSFPAPSFPPPPQLDNPFLPPPPASPTKSEGHPLYGSSLRPDTGNGTGGDGRSGGAPYPGRRKSRTSLPGSVGGAAAGGGGVGPIRSGAGGAGVRASTSGGGPGASGGTGGGGTATVAAASTGGAVAGTASAGAAPSPVVAALAAEVGPRTTEKSCKNCRLRKVKCDRQWPKCNRCTQRNEECSFGTFVPVDAIPPAALQTAMGATGVSAADVGTGQSERVTELEARIQSLEGELDAFRAMSISQGRPAPSQALAHLPPGPGGVVSPASSRSDRIGGVFGERQPTFQPVEGLSSAFAPPSSAAREASPATLSETIRSVFVAGAGVGSPHGPGQQAIETFLHGEMLKDPGLYGSPLALAGPFAGGGGGEGSGQTSGSSGSPSIGESSKEWKIARKAMARNLVIHLVQSFFASCCAYLPAFHGWHERRPWILANIDNLDPASRVAVAAFCAMGARASPHSALLGIPLSSPSPSDNFAYASAAGVRREQACRALHTQAMDLVHLLGITFDATKENLEAIMVMVQMLIFNELVPRRSRSMVHAALGHFKALQESSLPPNVKDDLLRHVGLPILTCDAITSAYSRKKPLITDRDLEEYFPTFLAFDFEQKNIQTVLQDCLRQNVSPEGLLTHEGIGRAAAVVHSWIAKCQRMFAQTAAPKPGGPQVELLQEIKVLWALLDEIHEGVRKLQEMLVHLSYVPHGCASDGCADQHLRFVTRLDKDLIDVFFLIHTLVTENMGLDSLVGEAGQAAYAESDRRIRKALKLVAFYSELYITSRDPHMTYHVVWQLEVLPNWTTIAVQRLGEVGGPSAPELELTDTELDWFVKGLVCSSYYHPVAISRLQELQHSRRPSFPGFQQYPSGAPGYAHSAASIAGSQPQQQQQGEGGYDPVSGLELRPHEHQHSHGHGQEASVSLYRPATTHYFTADAGLVLDFPAPQNGGGEGIQDIGGGADIGGGERIPNEDPRLTFQVSHTDTDEFDGVEQHWDDPSPPWA
ncbi:hypothetical protein JCM8547_008461 [Rhodosporidiobolus lusitaniae]